MCPYYNLKKFKNQISVKRIAVIISLLCVVIASAVAQSFSPVKSTDISNGLSHNGTTALLEDSRGYIWVGTYDGLNLLNSNSVTQYLSTPDNIIFSSNRVRSLAEDKFGRVWVGTDNGTTIFDYEKNSFKQIQINTPARKSTIIRDITLSEDGETAYMTTEDCAVIEVTINNLNYKYNSPAIDFPNIEYKDIAKTEQGNLLIASSKGLVEYNPSTAKYTKVLSDKLTEATAVTILSENLCVVADTKNLRWIEFNKEGYKITKRTPHNFAKQYVRALHFDKENKLWIGTYGLGTYICENGKISPRNTVKSGWHRVSDLLETSTGEMLTSTFDNGVMHYRVDGDKFTPFTTTKSPLVKYYDFFNYSENEILLSSNEGVEIYNTLSKKTYAPLDKYKETDHISKAVYCAGDKTIWVAVITNSNTKLYKIKDNKIHTLKGLEYLKKFNTVPNSTGNDSYGNLWLNFEEELLRIRFDKDGEVLSLDNITFINSMMNIEIGRVRCIFMDDKTNSLLIGSESAGLIKLTNIDAQSINEIDVQHYTHSIADSTSLPSNFVSHILRAGNDKLYISTEQGGFCEAETSGDKMTFKSYNTENGLCNNAVKNIVSSPDGKSLYIATNNGLSVFSTETCDFLNYSSADGLPFDDFIFSAINLDSTNMLFAGTVGAVTFDSKRLKFEEKIPKMQFGAFTLMGNEVKAGDEIDGEILLTSTLKDRSTITLNSDQNIFSVDVNSLHYANPTSHFIRYRLSPLSEQWITTTSDKNTISFSGLHPDSYTLSVQVSDINKNWSTPRTLYIEILPPLYRTWWAFTLYAILLLAVFLYILHYINKFQRMKNEIKLEELEKRTLKESFEEKQKFYANISHELKTPLTLISVPMTSIYEKVEKQSEIKREVHSVQRQVGKISRLIDVMTSAQLDNYRLLTPKYMVFNINSFLKNTLYDFRPLATEKKITLEINKPADDIYVRADFSMIEKVVNNIINNAFKYTEQDGEIAVKWWNEDDTLFMQISDNGIGISQSNLEHIFDRYFTTKDANNLSGTGIGLAFSKRLVEMHSGTISVESEIDKGTSFTIEMPIIAEKPLDTDLPEDPTTSSIIIGNINELMSKANDTEPTKLLYVVEDDPEVRFMLRGILSRFYKVKSFTNGSECLKHMESEWPDIIVSDVLMPYVDGYTLCQKVKENIATCHIPVILLSACGTVNDKIIGLESGADAYISKPFYPQHLLSRIETLLENRERLMHKYQEGVIAAAEEMSEAQEQAEEQPTAQDTKDIEFIAKLKDYMLRNIDEEIKVDELARELGINRTYLYQKVKALTESTPQILLRDLRLNRAAELLGSGDYLVADVCDMVGFKSRTSFSRAFKDKFGTAPNSYRTDKTAPKR